MSTATVNRMGGELRAICGAEHVIEDPVELQKYQVLNVVPSFAVMPGSADETAAILRLANERRLSVVPAGGFTAQHSGNAPAQIGRASCRERV